MFDFNPFRTRTPRRGLVFAVLALVAAVFFPAAVLGQDSRPADPAAPFPLLTVVGYAVAGVVAVVLWFAAKKGGIVRQLAEAITSATQRAFNKYIEEEAAARTPGSDGGVVVTPAEKSIARQHAFDLLFSELKGPALDLAKQYGSQLLKGLIGAKLDALLQKAGIKTTDSDGKPPAGAS